MAAQRTAVVTGASSGIGEATVLALAGAGFATVAAARRLERCERLAAETVSNPAADRDRTVASPIPLEAPVMSAIRPTGRG